MAAAIAIMWANTGQMQTRDLGVDVGTPTLLVILAIAGVSVGRVRSGLGAG